MSETQLVLDVAQLLAKTIVENGGEIYRAEEAVERMGKAYPDISLDVVALPTGVFLSASENGSSTASSVCRFKNNCINLDVLDKANDISRAVCEKKITLSEAQKKLRALSHTKKTNPFVSSLISAAGAGGICILFGGIWFDFFVSLSAAFISTLSGKLITGKILHGFLEYLICSMVSSIVAVIAVAIFKTGNIGIIVIASIFRLLPGIAMANAIHDSVRGDFISGIARLADALVTALALAFGVGIVMWLYEALGGIFVV